MLLYTSALNCTLCENHFYCYISLLVSFIWLCNGVFVKWNFLWSTIPLQFHKSDYGLVTVAWDSSKICLFSTIGIEAILNYCYESACVVSLLWWLQNIWSCVFYDLAAISTACINSMTDCSMEWSFICGFNISFANVWKHNQCCNDIYTGISPEVCSLI